MKTFLMAVALSVGFSAFAGTTRGYLSENHGLKFYAGLDRQDSDLQLSLEMHFTKKQISAMYACMGKRETHAIQVVSHGKATPVPSDISGRMTSFHTTIIDKLTCVAAPGFLYHWRNVFNHQ